jgi:hypothetical protein
VLCAENLPLFEKEGQGEIFRMSPVEHFQQIPLIPPLSKGEVLAVVEKAIDPLDQ